MRLSACERTFSFLFVFGARNITDPGAVMLLSNKHYSGDYTKSSTSQCEAKHTHTHTHTQTRQRGTGSYADEHTLSQK